MTKLPLAVRKARRAHKREHKNLRHQDPCACKTCRLLSSIRIFEFQKSLEKSSLDQDRSGGKDTHCVPRKMAQDIAAPQPLCYRPKNPEQPPQPEVPQALRRVSQALPQVPQALRGKVFRVDVTIFPRNAALAIAAEEDAIWGVQGRSVYWADSFLLEIASGIGISFCSSAGKWSELSYHIRERVPTEAREVYSIAKALDVAWINCRDVEVERRPRKVIVYSDSCEALRFFAGLREDLNGMMKVMHAEEQVSPAIVAVEELGTLGISVELRYVPGCAGIEGNLKAHEAARRGARCFGKKQGHGMIVNWVCLKGKGDI